MKRFIYSSLIMGLALITSTTWAQFVGPKNFDYSILENKTLYIPKFTENSTYAKKLVKKGKFDKLADLKARVEYYNNMWKEAMAQSSYDATPYEIKGFNRRELLKAKDEKAILLHYQVDDYGNWQAQLWVCGPKRKMIANAIITGLNLADGKDVRLMMNMLNYSLQTASEIQEEGDKVSLHARRSKYKENLIEFMDNIKDKTFLVPKEVNEKKPKKAEQHNADLAEALKLWKLSPYKLTTLEDVNEKRLNGDPDSYYWKNFNLYTNNPLITYRVNFVFTTEKDEVVFWFLGNKRLKPRTLEEMQTKLVSKSEKYKKQMEK